MLPQINMRNTGTGLSKAVKIHAVIAPICAIINPAFQPDKIHAPVTMKVMRTALIPPRTAIP